MWQLLVLRWPFLALLASRMTASFRLKTLGSGRPTLARSPLERHGYRSAAFDSRSTELVEVKPRLAHGLSPT